MFLVIPNIIMRSDVHLLVPSKISNVMYDNNELAMWLLNIAGYWWTPFQHKILSCATRTIKISCSFCWVDWEYKLKTVIWYVWKYWKSKSFKWANNNCFKSIGDLNANCEPLDLNLVPLMKQWNLFKNIVSVISC